MRKNLLIFLLLCLLTMGAQAQLKPRVKQEPVTCFMKAWGEWDDE